MQYHYSTPPLLLHPFALHSPIYFFLLPLTLPVLVILLLHSWLHMHYLHRIPQLEYRQRKSFLHVYPTPSLNNQFVFFVFFLVGLGEKWRQRFWRKWEARKESFG
ncbi:hypothetical protein AX774_g3017 [Zancudomyces culisetae]|uniref:Uncharacterized protein n=1 Tax=Zancudomyces culisetae TaxID=1213189 RepID=A0A1R1PR85_ZANCU|nr:hypothetical protein AX774_g3017 [Zancudomyces culisetae]|eukprot:OMH83477.1 hypothetical protein AX774_g3017 [Zancudomyces culisetae]